MTPSSLFTPISYLCTVARSSNLFGVVGCGAIRHRSLSSGRGVSESCRVCSFCSFDLSIDSETGHLVSLFWHSTLAVHVLSDFFVWLIRVTPVTAYVALCFARHNFPDLPSFLLHRDHSSVTLKASILRTRQVWLLADYHQRERRLAEQRLFIAQTFLPHAVALPAQIFLGGRNVDFRRATVFCMKILPLKAQND